MIYFTSSWDDGSVYDIKLSELLLKYNQKATFFIPLANIEKREVISPEQIANLSKDFEIGAHTVNHKYLTTISNEEAEYEIKQSKKELEFIINKQVQGFCFPGGKYKPIHMDYVNQAGFQYARTVNMFKLTNNSRVMNTSLQAYNHSKYTYFKHLLKRGYFIELFQNSISILSNNKWDGLLSDILDKQIKNNSRQETITIHLWGHSWEIQKNNSWNQLERFLIYVNDCQIDSKTNFEVSQLNQTITY
jgi:peptidoglycan/xylan/chitin deacetylase (PgdA/CDA1 family)